MTRLFGVKNEVCTLWHERIDIWQFRHWQRLLQPCEFARPTTMGNTMRRDTELLDAIQIYFDALYACDLALFDQVFHPACSLFDADEGRITVDPIANYRQVIAKRVSPASRAQDREDEIILIDWLSPKAATVKVRLRIHANIFIDHLCFARGAEGWRIVAKVWHLESVKA
ncbi:nuclear transport factor 2 family protein [Rhizobium aegyptiacum]|uniref:nuclear transport factor 2 family protein n=1 Tax=Rhizobium aegyptiacum TaxID=1764550 RepID=UPI000AB7F477|nr:nuclear transport factor 2 family protein [Rhizobium aegyptiacum]